MQLRYGLEDRAESDRKRLIAKRENMTVEEAISILSDKPEVVALVQAHLGHNVQQGSDHSHRHLRRHRHGHKGPAAEKAKEMLNKMIEEAVAKLDLERVRCSAFEQKQRAMMEESTQSIAAFNAQSAKARGLMMDADQQIDSLSNRIPAVQTSLQTLLKQCAADDNAFENQLRVIRDDVAIMEKLVAASSCTSANARSLIQCVDEETGDSFLGFGHCIVRQGVMSLQSESLRRGVREMLWEAHVDAAPKKPFKVPSEEMASFVQLPTVSLHQQRNQTDDDDGDDDNMSPKQLAKMRNKCVVSKNPNCNAMNDKFLFMQAQVLDEKIAIEQKRTAGAGTCKLSASNYESQGASMQSRLKDQQTALAKATEAQNEADEQSRLQTVEFQKYKSEYRKGMSECSTNIAGFENEECSLSKLRLEVFTTEGGTTTATAPYVADCEVSSWQAKPCSAECGGGVQRLERKITAHPVGGAACPALVMERACNEQACPVDCVLSEWGGWSVCSADCGGGVRQRSRVVLTQALHGGEACGETSMVQPCGAQACNENCKLGDWLAWGPCSQQCAAGFRARQRPVEVPPVGSGSCPDEESTERVEFEMCNPQPCVKPKNVTTFKCKAKLDVILLLDGSGSLGKYGWEATKIASSMFAMAMTGGDADVQLGVMLFSGPGTMGALNKCVGSGPGADSVDMEKDCNIKWVQRLDKDTPGAASKIERLIWPARTTLTSAALSMAEAELAFGRTDAQSIVVVITDGLPMSSIATTAAAESLRQKARLMWVAVTQHAPVKQIKAWASHPTKDNVIDVEDFETLERPSTIDTIIVDMCPHIY